MEGGLVFNIQRYSIQDGPGIRTTVFLKGCPLECRWCHNPESQSPDPEISLTTARCIRCGECWRVCGQCPDGEEGGTAELQPASCTLCGACVDACVTGARQRLGQRTTAPEVLAEIIKDRIFYDESGGGATFSGGEPLLQPQFLHDLLTACRDAGVHTAVDTCGYAPWEDLHPLVPLTDLFLYDLKTLDEARHQQYTGVSSLAIVENLQSLSRIHDNIWLRIPIVPGFNDDAQQLMAAARLAVRLQGVRRVCLLPYHPLGAHKLRGGLDGDHLARVNSPSLAQLEHLAQPFRNEGVPVEIGGSSMEADSR